MTEYHVTDPPDASRGSTVQTAAGGAETDDVQSDEFINDVEEKFFLYRANGSQDAADPVAWRKSFVIDFSQKNFIERGCK